LAALVALVSLVATVGFPAATWLWRQAEAARQQAVTMTGEAQKARADEAVRADQLSAALARNEVMLAYREWSANNLEQAEALLAGVPLHRRHWEWRYVNQLCHSDLFTLRGHTGQVWDVAYSPDGKRLASAGGDQRGADPGDVWVWDPNTGEQLLRFRGHSGPVRRLAYSPDGQRIASTSHVSGRSGSVEVKIWEVASGKELVAIPVDSSRSVFGLAFSPDGGRLATSSSDGVVGLWDAATGQKLWDVKWRPAMVDSVAFSPDGSLLASACRDGTVGLWDPTKGVEPRNLSTGSSAMWVCFSPDGRRLVSAHYDHTVRVWDPATGQALRTYRGHTSPVLCVTFSGDGRRLASIEASGTLRIWCALTGQDFLTIRGNTRWTWCLAFSPDGQRLATGLQDGTVRLWDLTSQQVSRILAGSWVRIPSLAFSPDGQRIIGATPWSVRSATPHGGVWDLVSGKTLHTLEHKNPVRGVAYSPDGRWLATASDDRTAKLWDAQTGKVIHTLSGHTQAVKCVAFSPDSLHVATGSVDGTARIWNVASGKGLRTCSGHSAAVNRLAYSPDGRHLASAGEDRAVRIWDPNTGQGVATLDGHAGAVTCMAISPTGRHLASASGKLVFLWDWDAVLPSVTAGGANTPRAAAPRLTLQGHADKVHDLAFTPDGHRLASTSEDWTVKVWDLETGSLALTLAEFGEVAHSVAFSPDGRLLVAGSTWNRVRVWDASDPTPAAKAAQRDAVALRASDWHQSEATACEHAGAWFGVVFHASRLLEAQPGQWRVHDLRGRAYAQLREWDRAAADLAAAVKLGADDRRTWTHFARVSLQRGDRQAYRRVCAQALERFGATRDPAMANTIAWICQLAPDAVTDPDRPVQLARRATAAQPQHRVYVNTLGAALYRAGQFAEAVRQLEDAVRLHGEGGTAHDWLFLAMAHHCLGQAAEARRWLDQTVRWLDALAATPPLDGSGDTVPWTHALDFRLLRREAEAMLAGTKP
jgi:WD40 repeat protein/Flp pilus assembly protein TadD